MGGHSVQIGIFRAWPRGVAPTNRRMLHGLAARDCFVAGQAGGDGWSRFPRAYAAWQPLLSRFWRFSMGCAGAGGLAGPRRYWRGPEIRGLGMDLFVDPFDYSGGLGGIVRLDGLEADPARCSGLVSD